MGAILSVVSMISQATGIIGAFNGGAKAAKFSGAVQDAVSVVTALAPLVTQFGKGEDVTPEQVREALAGKDAALVEFDKLIAEKDRGG